jgi:hypothetical protein
MAKRKSEPKKRPSGSTSLKNAGKRPVLLGIKEDDMVILDLACAAENRSRANFLEHHGMIAARKIAAKSEGEKQ